MKLVYSIAVFITASLANNCYATNSSNQMLLKFVPDCFIDSNFVQLQGLATISDHKTFIYLQCKNKDCKYTEINLRNDEVNGLSVSHLNFQASKISNSKTHWKMIWDRDNGLGDLWNIEWDKVLGRVVMKQTFKKSPPFRSGDMIDIYKLECKQN